MKLRKLLIWISSTMLVLSYSATIAWEGPYLGLDMGVDNQIGKTRINSGDEIETFRLNATNFNIGLLAGWGFVLERFYLAPELHIHHAAVEPEFRLTAGSELGDLKLKNKYDYGVSLKLGWLLTDTSMVYIKGGIDRSDFELSWFLDNDSVKTSKNLNGWLAGFGGEMKIPEISGASISIGYTFTHYLNKLRLPYSDDIIFRSEPRNHRFNIAFIYRFY